MAINQTANLMRFGWVPQGTNTGTTSGFCHPFYFLTGAIPHPLRFGRPPLGTVVGTSTRHDAYVLSAGRYALRLGHAK